MTDLENTPKLEDRLSQLPAWKGVDLSLGVRMPQELGHQLGRNPPLLKALEITAGDESNEVLAYLMNNAAKLDLTILNRGHVETRLTPPQIAEIAELPAVAHLSFTPGETFFVGPDVTGYSYLYSTSESA